MNIRWSNSGTTFLEIIIALAILALIAAPFMSTFVFAERTTIETGQIIDATFIAQKRLEQIHARNFADAIKLDNRLKEPFDGTFLDISAVPYHPQNPRFFNIVLQSTGTHLIVTTPTGGAIREMSSITGNTTTTINITAAGYSVTLPGHPTLSGTFASTGEVLLLMNAAGYTLDHRIILDITTVPGRACIVHVYETFDNFTDIIVRITGGSGNAVRRFRGFTTRNFSMVRARVGVFESVTATQPKAVMENILELRN